MSEPVRVELILDSDDAVARIARVIIQEGGTPGGNLHSWRCEYPDRYGACDCVRQIACEVWEALRR